MGEQSHGDASEKRGKWGNQLEFILTMVGFAVGLGNVWRFPYLCYRNGGGAFIVPYFISLVLLGMPLFFMELCFGQFASLGPLKIWIVNPMCKGVGMSVLLITSCIIIYYNVIVAYCIFYLFSSMTSNVPWTDCSNDWNTCLCRDSTMDVNSTFPWTNGSRLALECTGLNITQNAGLNIDTTTTPSEEFFLLKALRRTSGLDDSGIVLWDLSLCNLLAWTVIFLVLTKGVQSLGKVMYVASIFPYILLTILLVRGLTLEGHAQGVEFYLKPNITKLTEATVWSEAATQIFYSLGICQGGLIAMSSFNAFHTNTLRDSLIVPIINCLTSFYAGFVIFSVLGFMAHNKNTDVANVVADGPGLAFVAYPEALAQMPVSTLWSILFFLMMTMLGFSSQFSATETIFSSIMDEFPWLRKKTSRTIAFRACGCFLFFLLGLPMTTEGGFYLLNLVDQYVGGFPLLFAGLFELIAIMFIYGFTNFKKDIEMMLGSSGIIRGAIYAFAPMWCFITPLALVGVILFKSMDYKPLTMDDGKYDYPDFGDMIGWFVVVGPIAVVPLWYIGNYCYRGGARLWVHNSTPRPEWGPALKENRVHRYRRSAIGVSDVFTTSTSGDVNGTAYPGKHNLGYELDEDEVAETRLHN